MSQRHPNILIIMTDQHAPKVAGFAGDHVVRTQHLDQLAERSVHFPNAMCNSPVCTPSRMSMLTGKDMHHCSAWANHWVIFPEHTTLPQHFAEHGYVTSLIGKMHFGGRDQMQGFQYRPYGDLHHGLGHQPEPLSLFPSYMSAKSAGVTEIPESLLQDVVVTRETLSFVLEQHDHDPSQPWLTVAGYSRPHPPLTAPGRYIRHYRDRVPAPSPGDHGLDGLDPFAQRCHRNSRKGGLSEEEAQLGREGYYACVDFVDDCIGDLLDGLRAAGALDNTIVVYTADHGEMAGIHGLWNKTLYFDPSAGVPLLMTIPGVAEPASTIDAPISLMDLYPTLCGLVGLPIPDGLDGLDWSGTISSPESAEPPRSWAPCTFLLYGDRVGQGADAHGEPGSAWRSARERDWKYVEVRDSSPLLFDLRNDPAETTNLASEPAHAERCRAMRELVFDDFSWESTDRQLEIDRQRIKEHSSGVKPSMPNQYMFDDGRTFDAEAELYGARWLHIPPDTTGGIIPQMYG